MLKLLRLVILAVITVLLVEVVVAIASGATGALEKAVTVAFGLVLVLAASRARRLGAPRQRQASS